MDGSVKKNGEKIKHGADNSNKLTNSEEKYTNTNTNTNTNSNDNHHSGRSQTQPSTQPRRTLTNIDSQFSDSNQTGQTPISASHALNGNQLSLTASHSGGHGMSGGTPGPGIHIINYNPNSGTMNTMTMNVNRDMSLQNKTSLSVSAAGACKQYFIISSNIKCNN